MQRHSRSSVLERFSSFFKKRVKVRSNTLLTSRLLIQCQFRQFDPSFSGSSLSAIGALDRAMQRIQYDLAEWHMAYEQAFLLEKEPPRKPCHIIILTSSTAKLGMDWMPIYRMKVPRSRHPETRKLTARRNDEGQIVAMPCCPHCFHLIKNEREIERLKKSGEEWRELFKQVDELRAKGHLEIWREEAMLPPTIYLSEKEVLGTKDRRMKRWHSPIHYESMQSTSIISLSASLFLSPLRDAIGRSDPCENRAILCQ